jgi:hypothetical protein
MNKLFVQNKAKLKKSDRVTAKTIEEHREDVLKRGKKFRYPIQYAKHHLVLIAVSIGMIVVVGFAVGLWGVLYAAQDTGDIAFRITQILPLPVARVDGEMVRYGDFLIFYRSSIRPIERQNGLPEDSDDARMIRNHYKRMALNEAMKYAYARRLARELGITVTHEEVELLSREYRVINGVEKDNVSFLKIVYDNFGLREHEYYRLIEMSALRRRVAAEIDTQAGELAVKVERELETNGGNFFALSEELADKVNVETLAVGEGEFALDGGRAEVARGLEVGWVSDKFVSKNGNGYYFVKLIGREEGRIEYASIEIPFTEFERRFSELSNNGRIREFIRIDG